MTRVVLFPGSGSDRHHPSLVSIERAMRPVRTDRVDFPYRIAGRRPPDRPPVLLQAVRDATKGLRRNGLVLGGRSMGGRMCSMVVGDEHHPMAVKGLVLIAYPLHPPGKPDRLRVEHFPRLHVPCLFVSGTRDTFGTPEELMQWTATIPGPVTHHWFERKGHDLKGCDDAIGPLVSDWVSGL